jgi:hypothetical protein
MDSQPAVRRFDFPPQLDQAEIENRCARESFTWGPQALWLLCGLIWLFFGFVAFWRSYFKLAFFWIPNGKGKTNRSLYLHPRELRKIEEGDAQAIR